MSNLGNFVWSIADQLRGVYKPHQYGDVILPMTILRRLDCILGPTRDEVRGAPAKKHDRRRARRPGPQKTGLRFYNTCEYDFARLLADPDGLRPNLIDYIARFSREHRRVRAVQVRERDRHPRREEPAATSSCQKFAEVDLHPDTVTNAEMGDLFEELIRKFAEASNETAGEHFTPRDAIRLMVDLLFAEDDERAHRSRASSASIYDPTAGTGGMLSVAEEHLLGTRATPNRRRLRAVRPGDQRPVVRDLQVRHDRQGPGRHQHPARRHPRRRPLRRARTFDYCLSNPPYGVDWKAVAGGGQGRGAQVRRSGRFAGRAAADQRRPDAVPAAPGATRCGQRTRAAAGPGSS